MKPTEFQRISVEYLYGELTEEEGRKFEEHLESCENCRKEFEELKASRDLLDSLAPEQPSDKVRSSIVKFADRYANRKVTAGEKVLDFVYHHRKAFRYAAALFMLFAGLMFIIVHITRTGPDSPSLTGSPTPSVSAAVEVRDTKADVASLSITAIDSEIENVSGNIKSAEYPEVGFKNSFEFYESDNLQEGIYSPFSGSRPYRRISEITDEAKSLSDKITAF